MPRRDGQQLAAAAGAELEPVREGQTERWAGRFADLLDEDPGIEAEPCALVEEVAARLPSVAVSAADHSVAAGRDVPRGTRGRMQALPEEIGDEVPFSG